MCGTIYVTPTQCATNFNYILARCYILGHQALIEQPCRPRRRSLRCGTFLGRCMFHEPNREPRTAKRVLICVCGSVRQSFAVRRISATHQTYDMYYHNDRRRPHRPGRQVGQRVIGRLTLFTQIVRWRLFLLLLEVEWYKIMSYVCHFNCQCGVHINFEFYYSF